jgi:membrane protein YqaA with SNARE-associated domain
MEALAALAAMAAAAFAAASLLPAQSEAVFLAILAGGRTDPFTLFVVASLANTAGSVLNWWLGLMLARYGVERLPRRLRPDPATLVTAQRRFERYGWPSLLFAWLPVVGDPLTFVAGTLGMRLRTFLVPVLVGKAGRYGALWAGWAAV